MVLFLGHLGARFPVGTRIAVENIGGHFRVVGCLPDASLVEVPDHGIAYLYAFLCVRFHVQNWGTGYIGRARDYVERQRGTLPLQGPDQFIICFLVADLDAEPLRIFYDIDIFANAARRGCVGCGIYCHCVIGPAPRFPLLGPVHHDPFRGYAVALLGRLRPTPTRPTGQKAQREYSEKVALLQSGGTFAVSHLGHPLFPE